MALGGSTVNDFDVNSKAIFREHVEFRICCCVALFFFAYVFVFRKQVQRLLSQEVAARSIATAESGCIPYRSGSHFLQSGGSPPSRRAWARWLTRNQRELVTLFLASLADTFARQQLTQHSGY